MTRFPLNFQNIGFIYGNILLPAKYKVNCSAKFKFYQNSEFWNN